jgi:hypothetical protein
MPDITFGDKANVRIEFYNEVTGKFNIPPRDKLYYELFGFLTDEGLDLRLDNEFKNALDFGILEAFKSMAAGLKGLAGAIGESETHGYLTGGFGNSNIILNAPYYWQGTSPIQLNLSFYQISDTENDIILNYQRVMEILSPGMGIPSKEEGGAEAVTLAGSGPGLVYVHYFPSKGVGEGKMVFGPCLCKSVSMKIAPPYSLQYTPIIGVYNFGLQVSRIVDRTQIKNIFNNSSDTYAETKGK